MSDELPILNRSHIPNPCPMAWDNMTGDEKTRHCSQCEKSVYHLSYMTTAEANRVLEQSDGNLCIHGIFRKSDGQLVNIPTRGQRIARLFRRAIAVAVGLPLIAVLSGCGEQKLSGKLGQWVKPDEPEACPETGKMVEEGGLVMPFDPNDGSLELPEEL